MYFLIFGMFKKCYGDEDDVENGDVFSRMLDFGRFSVRSFRGDIIGSDP